MDSLTQRRVLLENKLSLYSQTIYPNLIEYEKELEKEKQSLSKDAYLEAKGEIEKTKIEILDEIIEIKNELEKINNSLRLCLKKGGQSW